MRQAIRSHAAGLISLAFLGCHPQTPGPTAHGSAAFRLRPVTTPLSEPSIRRTVYVAVYSSVQFGDPRLQTVQLSSTVSVRNVSPRHPVVLEFVRFYDSTGHHVRDYINSASELPALATVEFVVQRADTTGGPGARISYPVGGSCRGGRATDRSRNGRPDGERRNFFYQCGAGRAERTAIASPSRRRV